MKRVHWLYVKDIIEAIRSIEDFIGDMDFNEFKSDDKTTSAVVRKLEIIGEATKNLPESVTQNYPDLPWQDMARTRDKISHAYFEVDYEIVWKVIKEKLPDLVPNLQQIMKELKTRQ